MSEFNAWDLDGTIRPGAILGAAVIYGSERGFIDPDRYANVAIPTYPDADLFLQDITHLSRRDFAGLEATLSEQAREQAYPWALARLDEQKVHGTIVVMSHSPDFLVRAFCRGLGITQASGSYFQTRQLKFTGHAVLLNKQKTVNRKMRRSGATHIDFAAGDSRTDLPILKKARQAAVVNPDEELTQLAEQYGWEIVRTEA